MDFLRGLCIEASGTQGLVVFYEDDRDIDPLVTRLDPYVSGVPFKDQFALREWRAAWALEKHVLKRHGSVYLRKFTSINIVMLVEPTFQPINRFDAT